MLEPLQKGRRAFEWEGQPAAQSHKIQERFGEIFLRWTELPMRLLPKFMPIPMGKAAKEPHFCGRGISQGEKSCKSSQKPFRYNSVRYMPARTE